MLRFTANHFLTRVFICVRKAERVSTRRRMARGHTFRFSRTNENSRCGLVGKIEIVRFDGFRQIWAVCSCNEPPVLPHLGELVRRQHVRSGAVIDERDATPGISVAVVF